MKSKLDQQEAGPNAKGLPIGSDRDTSIMATNDSSIVSKRAAELAYCSEPHFLRYFVKKKKTRAPLINRGYWLRMKAIEFVVHQFLQTESGKRKVVVNLGAGYDALAFRMLATEPELCKNALFADVDYGELIERKREMIKNSQTIRDLLPELGFPETKNLVLLESTRYVAAGCDLNKPEQLREFLTKYLNPEKDEFLFVAEVSITYMGVSQADDVIKVAAEFGGRFCLLEQFLPRGPDHAFARTMLRHFHKVNSPLMSVTTYDTLQKQQERFELAGWKCVRVRSLWELWTESKFISHEMKAEIDHKEPFDEWEDFALFASHYFLLVASTADSSLDRFLPSEKLDSQENGIERADAPNGHPEAETASSWTVAPVELCHKNDSSNSNQVSTTSTFNRRYGALLQTQEPLVTIYGGYVDGGKEPGRTRKSLLLSTNSKDLANSEAHTAPTLGATMCHTITALNSGNDCLQVGGRTSPALPVAACWLRESGTWQQAEDLPVPLYRHASTAVSACEGIHGVLVFGGRTMNSEASGSWYFWQREKGWVGLDCTGDIPEARFAASLATSSQDTSSGILIGGLNQSGEVLTDCYSWTLTHSSGKQAIQSKRLQASESSKVARFGASLVASRDGYFLVGGFGIQGAPEPADVIMFNKYESQEWFGVNDNPKLPQQMILAGHHVAIHSDGLLVYGGGAVCFSFGSYTNTQVYRLKWTRDQEPEVWYIADAGNQSRAPTAKDPRKVLETEQSTLNPGAPPSAVNIKSLDIQDPHTFAKTVQSPAPEPFVMSRVPLGVCLDKWTLPYLCQKIGPQRQITVHRASTQHMTFQSESRNFSYATCTFGEFAESIGGGGREYFRALSSQDERDTPANFHSDFAEVARDFALPGYMELASQHLHSSVLRISGPVSMWLHYDVMANVLCQISGSKELVLFPPSDVIYLDLHPGASNSSLDVFASGAFEREPLVHTHPYRVTLKPGQILFIPPLWLHAAKPNDEVSIAVNVFFRDLNKGYAAGRDTYGNRDLQSYEEGRKDIKKIAQRFQSLPQQVSRFYLDRLVQEFKDAATRQ